jgi:zinc transport system ATP-binding protein
MSSAPIIELDHVTFRYGDQTVLEDVSMRVEPGEFLGVIGPNGGGKTTILRVMLGLETGYQGSVKILGEVPSKSFAWRRRVGVVPQHRDLTPRFPIRAGDVVALGMVVRGAPSVPRSERRSRVEEALSLVGASGYADRPLWELSGGQRQRVFVARALVNKPELLLLDEPTVGVDAEGQDLLLEWIAHWKQEAGITVVLVTHDVGVVATLADKLACLNVRLHFHDRPDRLTGDDIQKTYGCPAEVIFHSAMAIPHTVLKEHRH